MTPAIDGLEALRRHVWADPDLIERLYAIEDRASLVAEVVAIGRTCGCALAPADVVAALRAGEDVWLMQGAPVM